VNLCVQASPLPFKLLPFLLKLIHQLLRTLMLYSSTTSYYYLRNLYSITFLNLDEHLRRL